jgi:hypothetical protein
MTESAGIYGNPVLAKEFVSHLNGKYNLRLYYTPAKADERRFRWHFGYPEQIIKYLLPLLETTPFWGDQHWLELDGYYVYVLHVVTDTNGLTVNLLNDLRFEDKVLLGLYNDCVGAYKKWYPELFAIGIVENEKQAI